MIHLGDITQLKGSELPIVDIVTGGSPCQDLSVAGKRAGLDGERSGLFMEQIRVIKEMRNEFTEQLRLRGANVNIRDIKPRYMVWENVPGAFSSNKGEDFRCVLEETARIADESAVIPPLGEKQRWTPSGCIMGDGWSIAWRVHDAQFWGVPQRRKRIALVADFGGLTAPEILFEREGVSRDIEKSREEGEGIAADTERSIDKAIGVDAYNFKLTGETAVTLNATSCDSPSHSGPSVLQNKAISFQERAGKPGGAKDCLYNVSEQEHCQRSITNPSCLNSWDVQSKHIQPENGKAEALYSGECRGGGGESYVFCLEGNGQRESHKGDGYKESETMYTLNTVEQHGVVYSIGHDVRSAKFTDDEVTDPLTATDYKDPQVIAYQNTVGALCARDYKGIGSQYVEEDKCITQSVVRRLTPLECERLQGYPDHWTDIGEWTDSKGKKHKDADSPRYKALGNSIALPFWEWMAGRMVEQLKKDGVEQLTMASLFDGIGGFPLVYSRCGCKPIWASEIEEFPIAVTKIRFPEQEKEIEDGSKGNVKTEL